MSRLTIPLSFLVFLTLLVSCSNMDDNTLATVGGKTISMDDFTKINPASRFVNKDNTFIDSKVDEFVDRELFTMAAFEKGFDQDPSVLRKKQETERRFMLQHVYEKAIMDAVIGEDYLKKAYDRSGVELKARHILLQFAGSGRSRSERSKTDALALAKQIKGRLAAGEAFEGLAKEYTEDPSGKETGGDLGWFGWGQMVGPFQEAAFALNPGEVSAVSETDFGFHIIKLEETRDVERGAFEQEKPRMLDQARREKGQELNIRASEFIDEQKTTAGFEYYPENISEFMVVFNASGSSNLPMDEVFKKINLDKPLFTLKGEDVDGAWIINELQNIDEAQRPRFNTENQLKAILEQLVVQSLIVDYGFGQGYDKDETFASTVNETLSRVVYDAYVAQEINTTLNPDEEALMAYYEKNKSEKYMDKKKVRVSEIFIKDSLLAVDIKKRIDAGEEIASLASRYSERKVSREKAGELPPFQEGRYGMMGKKAFELELGQIAGPVKVGNGYSIIRLEEILPETARPFKQVQARIKTQMLGELRTARTEELSKELKKEFPVKVNYKAVYRYYAPSEDTDA